jgi:hypothetical protein
MDSNADTMLGRVLDAPERPYFTDLLNEIQALRKENFDLRTELFIARQSVSEMMSKKNEDQ